MSYRLRYGLAALVFACASAHAMTVDELIAKNLAARGGLEKIHAIKTLKSEGKLRFGGQFELAFVQYQKAPDSSRSEASLQGLTAVQAWDGKDAWQISPFQGRKDPEKMSADDAKALADDAPIGGPLVGLAGARQQGRVSRHRRRRRHRRAQAQGDAGERRHRRTSISIPTSSSKSARSRSARCAARASKA